MTGDVLLQLAEILAAAGPPAPGVVEACTFDAVGCVVAGGGIAEGAAIADFTTQLARSNGNAPWSAGQLDDVFASVAIARLTELDDIHMSSCITAGGVVVPTAVLVAGMLGGDPERYALAVGAGYEAMIRLGRAIDGAHVVYSGVWPSCLCAPVGTAAVTAELLGLDPARTAGALSLAMTMAMSTGGGHHAQLPGRWLTIGQAARAGCVAALAAARGYSAPLDLGRFPPATIDTTALLRGGEARAIEEVSVKPFPGAKQTMAATEAALRLRDRVALADIRRIVVSVPECFVGMIAEPPDGGRQSRLVSVAWNVALALCDPQRLADLERPGTADPDLRRLTDLVSVRGDRELSAAYPARWPARLEIHTSHGVIEELVTESAGDPGTNQTELLAEKWQQVLGPSAARWRERCSEGIASAEGVRGLAAELRNAPRADGPA